MNGVRKVLANAINIFGARRSSSNTLSNRFGDDNPGDLELDEDIYEIRDNAALMREDNRLVLVVDTQLNDVPSWMQLNPEPGQRRISITFQSGRVANLSMIIPDDDIQVLKQSRRILLVSNDDDGRKIMHFLPFVMHG